MGLKRGFDKCNVCYTTLSSKKMLQKYILIKIKSTEQEMLT